MIGCRPYFPICRNIKLSKSRTLHALLIVASLVIVALLVAFNVVSIRATFENGPPYLARVTSRDASAWSDPLPALIAVDSVAVLIVAWSLLWGVQTQVRESIRFDIERERALECARPHDAVRTVVIAAFLDFERQAARA